MSLTEYDEEECIRTWRNDGIAEGREQKAMETAKRMIEKGKFSKEEIAEISGLSLCEIQSLC